jgi:hypothetical protein
MTMTTATTPRPGLVDEHAARGDLLRQITRLDGTVPAATRGPRLLSLAELEHVRDALVDAAGAAREAEVAAERAHAAARARLEAMYADPAAHRWARISREQLGLKGCGHFHVRPRLGLLGMLRGWWVVKVSSGCPLAGRQSASSGAIVSPESASCSQ